MFTFLAFLGFYILSTILVFYGIKFSNKFLTDVEKFDIVSLLFIPFANIVILIGVGLGAIGSYIHCSRIMDILEDWIKNKKQ